MMALVVSPSPLLWVRVARAACLAMVATAACRHQVAVNFQYSGHRTHAEAIPYDAFFEGWLRAPCHRARNHPVV